MGPRLRRLSQVLAILLGVLGLRLIQLQIVQGGRYTDLSDRNRIRHIERPAARGRVFDRHGRLIADTRPSFTVSAVPTELGESTLARLAGLIGVPLDEMEERIAPVALLSAPVKLRRALDRNALFRVEENMFRLPGIRTIIDPVRHYPDSELYCHVLGHLGEVNADDIAADSTLQPLDQVGRAGIEDRYESVLRGVDGHEYLEVDASGQEIGPLPEKRPVPAVPGRDLHLTIDHRLQELAHSMTARYERAAVVGIEITTGDVLCLVSRPGFDPNLFTVPLTPETWRSLSENRSKPFFNRVSTSTYPPGSVFKPIVALSALEQALVGPRTRFKPCAGSFRYGNRTFKCWSTHGSQNLLGAIAHSCNVYFYQLGIGLGLDSLAAYCQRLRLPERTGIDLPLEGIGSIPTRQSLDRRYGAGKWTSGVMLNFAIGQGEIQLTPLQLAMAYAAIGRNGSYRRPHLLSRVDSAGVPLRKVRTETVTVPIEAIDLRLVKEALSRVVEHGTAQAARMREIVIAGKTGTAENPLGADHAWFVGYAPADKPDVVFAVLVENAGHGGVVAAPIARQLIRAWFDITEEPAE